MTNLKIHKLKCLNTSESTKAFNYRAQTPTTFLIEKIDNSKNNIKNLKIFDKIESYIDYILKYNEPIPINGINIIKITKIFNKLWNIKYIKTNSTPKKMILSNISGKLPIF